MDEGSRVTENKSGNFIHWVIDERQIDPDKVEIIVGIDDGQGMLKVSYIIFTYILGGTLALHPVVVHRWDTCPPPPPSHGQ